MNYLIAYDICEPGRLRRVARLLEKHAVRCQKSVFLFSGSAQQLQDLLESTAGLIQPDEDLVQAWRLAQGESRGGIRQGEKAVQFPRAAVLREGPTLCIGEENA